MNSDMQQQGLNKPASFSTPGAPTSPTVSQHFIRVLYCTAKAFASSPDGCQVSGVTQRWIDGLAKLHRVESRPASLRPGESFAVTDAHRPESKAPIAGLSYSLTGAIHF